MSPSHSHTMQNLNPQDGLYQLTALLGAVEDAVIGHALDHRILHWNPGAQRLYGCSAAEMLDRPITILFPQEYQEEITQILERVGQGERITQFPTVNLTSGGQRLDIEWTVTPVRDAEGNILSFWTLVRDISRRKETEQEMKRLQEDAADRRVVLETANRVALDILASRTGVEALRHIAEAARALSRARYAALGVARPDGEGLLEFVTTGLTPEQETLIGPRPEGRGLLGLLLQRTTPLRVDRLAGHSASSGFPPNHPPMESFLGVPIRRGEEAIGSLYLTNKEGGGPFTEADEIAVQALGAHAAVAIHHWSLMSRQRALVKGLILAQEEERRAVAYDLHDGLTQYVMASHIHLEAFKLAQERANAERAGRELTQSLLYLKNAVVESRRLVNGLRSLALDDLGLSGALEQLLNEEKARAGWQEVEYLHNLEGSRYDPTLETCIFRVVQEALNNVRKHAQTQRIRIALVLETPAVPEEPRLALEVRDWGLGFVPEEKMEETGRVGLHSMAERVGLIGGAFTLQSAPGEGTLIRAIFPLLERNENEILGGKR